MFHRILVNVKPGGNNIGSRHSTVNNLFRCADSGTDNLRLFIETVVFIYLYNVLYVFPAVFSIGLFPSDERGY